MKQDARLPAIGAIMVRKYKGLEIKVTVVDQGFEYQGQTWKSLSKLAGHICGQKAINGFNFFKLGASPVKKTHKTM